MTAPSSDAASPDKPPSLYSYYVLALLTLVFVMNIADRQVIAIVAEPIKHELNLQDWQLGMLTGPATALLYAVLALPMAYIADRVNRARFLALACGIWSVITALGGVAQNVWQLAATRLGVSIAEAGGSPASLSILSDHFSAKRRGTALAIWSSATSIGIFVGFGLGGIAHDYVGWRGAFVVAGIPGAILAVIVWFTMKERVRGTADALPPPPVDAKKAPIWRDMGGLLKVRMLRAIIIAASFSNVAVFAIFSWGPSMALRNFDVSHGQVGATIGVGIAICGLVFSLLSGAMIDFLGKRNPSYPMIMIAGTQIAAAVLFSLAMTSTSFEQYSILLPLTFGMLMTFGPLNLSIIQSYAQPWRRSMVAALNSFSMSVVGPGIAVPVIGAISDYVSGGADNGESLRTAMLSVVPPALGLAAIAYLGVAYAASRERPDSAAIAAASVH